MSDVRNSSPIGGTRPPHVDTISSDSDSSYATVQSATSNSNEEEEQSTSTRTENKDLEREKDDMEKVEMLCYVLDIKSSSKLDDIDIMPGQDLTPESRPRVHKLIEELESTKLRRFKQLKGLGQQLIKVWTTNHVTLNKGVNLIVVYAVANAESANEIIGEKFLSSSMIKKVNDEIKSVKNKIEKKITAKYLERKNKVKQLMSSTQLIPSDIDIDLDDHVVPLHDASTRMKKVAKDLKKKVLERKELLLIIDSVKIALENDWPLDVTKGLLDKANQQVQHMLKQSKDMYVAYNGDDVTVILQNFLCAAITLHNEALEDQMESSLEPSKTRSGTSFKPEAAHPEVIHVHEGTQSASTENRDYVQDSETWIKVDTKNILNISYDVRNLKKAVECCTKGFGMEILREVMGTGDTCTEVYLGFGSQRAGFALRPHSTAIHGLTEHGFGHIKVSVSNVHKVIGKIKPLPGCGVLHEPRTFRGGSYKVSHTYDLNGTLFELTEKRTFSDIICGMMIYVTNLDVSINFYMKVLGMGLMYCKGDTCLLGYNKEDAKAPVLELRVNAESTKGSGCKFTIETDDIVKTFIATEILCTRFGGKLLQESDSLMTRDFFSLLDPDGWEIVLVERERIARGASRDTETGPET